MHPARHGSVAPKATLAAPEAEAVEVPPQLREGLELPVDHLWSHDKNLVAGVLGLQGLDVRQGEVVPEHQPLVGGEEHLALVLEVDRLRSGLALQHLLSVLPIEQPQRGLVAQVVRDGVLRQWPFLGVKSQHVRHPRHFVVKSQHHVVGVDALAVGRSKEVHRVAHHSARPVHLGPEVPPRHSDVIRMPARHHALVTPPSWPAAALPAPHRERRLVVGVDVLALARGVVHHTSGGLPEQHLDAQKAAGRLAEVGPGDLARGEVLDAGREVLLPRLDVLLGLLRLAPLQHPFLVAALPRLERGALVARRAVL
mmetsp:Transcript_32047/g.102064  ORF Transcript_32047/g.102064 Transcript_32047/m.102064 type:complete len:311 (-) Transcript_32047:224-1156(-)